MRLNEQEKSFIVGMLHRVYKNVKTGENAQENTTDESLMFHFSEESMEQFDKLMTKFAREYELN